jgi:cytosine/adenosine deaminase-related metal-dependent hydrolase
VGSRPDLGACYFGAPELDLGDVILMPGLINAHCHLDYTGMAAGIPPQRSFPDWIKAILAHKAAWSYTDFAESWVRGAAMLLRNGVTTVVDIEAVPELLPEVWAATPLRVVSAVEMTGIRSGKSPAFIVREALAAFPNPPDERKLPALSPHSLYATRPELLALADAAARERGWLLSIHVAESREEFDMFVHRRGRLHDWLSGQRDLSDCAGVSPVASLDRLGVLSPRLLAVHANCLGDGDVERLARSGTHVVHCPRSHDYFQHPPFPLEDLRQAGVNICLGTDSLASVRGTRRRSMELNLFKEMQTMSDCFPNLPPEPIVRMATLNGARALGRAGELGELTPGARADLIAIPWSGPLPEVFEAIVRNEAPVVASYLAGQKHV